jgi:hypothetical protein
VTDTSALTAAEFLGLRRSIADNYELLEPFDDQLRDMCTQQPDEAAQIFDTLARSDSTQDREAAAIYTRHLLAGPRRDTAATLLRQLRADPDKDIRQHACDSITAALSNRIITATDAARIHDHQPT